MNAEPRLTPFPSADVPWQDFSEVPRFQSRFRHLSRAALGKAYHVGVVVEELGAGMQSCPAHYHIFEEEHVYILDGALTLRLGDARFTMKAGDYACFPAGQRAGHCFINESVAVCRYLMLGPRNPNEVAVYTDSNKVLVRALGHDGIFDLAAKRNYWHGEDTGLPDGVLPSSRAAEPAAPETVKLPVSSHELQWDTEGDGPQFGGRSKHLTYAATGGPNYQIGVLIESPAPGMRLCPTHYHMAEEEHAFILEGEVTLILGEERHVMKPGDYVCFPAGRRVGHSLMNSGTGPCSYLMIGERNPNEVCVYPDSKKAYMRTLDGNFDMSTPLDYWAGEKTN